MCVTNAGSAVQGKRARYRAVVRRRKRFNRAVYRGSLTWYLVSFMKRLLSYEIKSFV